MKKRIIFFLPNLHGGGAERVAVNMLRILDTELFDIHLVLVKKSGEYLDLLPNYIKVHDLKASKTLFSIFKLKSKIDEIKPDIVYSSLLMANIVLYLSLLFCKTKPYTILRSPNSPKLLLDNNQLSNIMWYFLEKAYKKADLVIAQTPEMKNELSKYHNLNAGKIKVFLNPIDTKLIDKKTDNCENPFNSEDINIVAAGRLTYQKGFDILLHSFKNVILENDKFLLHIIGKDDGEEEKLKDIVKEIKLEKYVKFLGFQENPYQFFKYADLYVLSSRWEGLPNTVLENLYLRKPIVSTRCIPFMNELISNGKNGLLVDVENENQIATAILNYKSIDTSYTNNLNENDVNLLFNEISGKINEI